LKKIIILPDVHLRPDYIPKPYQTVKKFIKDFKPSEIVILGDFMEVEALSSYDLSKRRKIEGKRYEKEVDTANKELDYLQKYCNKITFLMGNHEYRTQRYLDDHPELEGMLEIPKRLHLKERGIKWLPMNKSYQIGKLHFIHGVYYNKYHAQKHLAEYGDNIVYGHTHRPQITYANQKFAKIPYGSFGLGCLGDTEPSYKKNSPTGHINQFAVVYVNNKGNFNIYPVNVIDNKFIFNGKEYN
jgi:predicted phosphodiesterase